MSLIGIAIFAYNRASHLETLLESLEKSSKFPSLPVHIFLDGSRDLLDSVKTRRVAELCEDFKHRNENVTLHSSASNLGLAKSIIGGLNTMFLAYDSVIVLEDDLILGEYFLDYMILSLTKYSSDRRIGSVSGSKDGIFLSCLKSDIVATYRHNCWGWGTWKDRWSEIIWEQPAIGTSEYDLQKSRLAAIGSDLPQIYELQALGQVNSWSILFDANAANFDWLCLQPRHNLIVNNGMDGSGTHFNLRTSVIKPKKLRRFSQIPNTTFYVESRIFNLTVKFSKSRFWRELYRQKHRIIHALERILVRN